MLVWVIMRWILLGFLGFSFFVFVILRILKRYYHFPIPAFLTRFIDNPLRRRFIQPPKRLAERMQVEPGMTVVEIGSGQGSYSKAVAKNIMPRGKVYAVDIQESVIERLRKSVKREGIPNIIPTIDDAYNLSFADESVDRIFAVACLPEIPDPVKALREWYRILKPHGLVCLSELALEPDYPLRRTEKRWAQEAGLELKQAFGNWFVYQLNFGKYEEEEWKIKWKRGPLKPLTRTPATPDLGIRPARGGNEKQVPRRDHTTRNKEEQQGSGITKQALREAGNKGTKKRRGQATANIQQPTSKIQQPTSNKRTHGTGTGMGHKDRETARKKGRKKTRKNKRQCDRYFFFEYFGGNF